MFYRKNIAGALSPLRIFLILLLLISANTGEWKAAFWWITGGWISVLLEDTFIQRSGSPEWESYSKLRLIGGLGVLCAPALIMTINVAHSNSDISGTLIILNGLALLGDYLVLVAREHLVHDPQTLFRKWGIRAIVFLGDFAFQVFAAIAWITYKAYGSDIEGWAVMCALLGVIGYGLQPKIQMWWQGQL